MNDEPKTVEFLTFVETPGLKAFSKEDRGAEAVQQAIDRCAERSGANRYERRGVALEGAQCAHLSQRLGWQVGLERALCAMCQLHGGPGAPENAWLTHHAKHLVYAVAIPNPSLAGSQEKPLPLTLDRAVAAAKSLSGDEVATDLVTTMVATDVATPEEAVALLEKHALIPVGDVKE